MKVKFFITSLLICVFALVIPAQQTKTSKPGKRANDKTSSQTTNKPKQVRQILGFAKPELMFQILNGKWLYMETDCQKAFEIKVSPDRQAIRLIYPKSEERAERIEYIYNVLEVGKYSIRTQIEGEKRLTDNGKPIVWDFMFLSADEFVWHRTDWDGLNSTPPATRCKEEKQIAILSKQLQ